MIIILLIVPIVIVGLIIVSLNLRNKKKQDQTTNVIKKSLKK